MRRLFDTIAKAIRRALGAAPRRADPFEAGAYADDFHRRAQIAIRGFPATRPLSRDTGASTDER